MGRDYHSVFTLLLNVIENEIKNYTTEKPYN